MKNKNTHLINTVIAAAASIQLANAQNIVEVFDAGEPFQTGLPGQFVVSPTTVGSADDRTFFASSDPTTGSLGSLSSTDLRSLTSSNAGSTMRATFLNPGEPNVSGTSSFSLDMGSEIAFTNLANHSVISSSISFVDIDTSVTEGLINENEYFFNFSGAFADGSSATDVSDFNISFIDGTFDIVNTATPGVFSATLTSSTGVDGVRISFESSTGSLLRSMEFTDINPSGGGDLVAIVADRTLAPIPEPSSVILGSLGLFALTVRRKRG